MKTAFAIAALAVALAGGGHHVSGHKSSVAVGVAEREWGISSYRAKVKRGRVSFNVTNFGQDSHNLQVLGPHGYRSAVTTDIHPHDHTTLTLLLRRPGVYRLICTKPGHLKLGMRATIRVAR
jgi:plastocyanin